MIAETANLTTGLVDVKQAQTATNRQTLSSKDAEERRVFQMFSREQSFSVGCLTEGRPEKRSRSNGVELLAERRPQGGAE